MEWLLGCFALFAIIFGTGCIAMSHSFEPPGYEQETYSIDNETMAKIITAVRADAWNEGYAASQSTLGKRPDYPPVNPYRQG